MVFKKITFFTFLLTLYFLAGCSKDESTSSEDKLTNSVQNEVPDDTKRQLNSAVDRQPETDNLHSNENEVSPLTNILRKRSDLDPANFIAEGSGTVFLRNQKNDSESTSQTPLYVIDGIPLDGTPRASTGTWGSPNYENPSDISQSEILSMQVLSINQAMEKYGEAGKNGAIEITTLRGSGTGISYIRSDDNKTYSRDDAAEYGFKNLLIEENDGRKTNNR